MKFKNTEVWGFRNSMRGMRKPMEWDKSDSGVCKGGDDGIGCENCAIQSKCKHSYDKEFKIGKCDMELAQSLLKAGNEHVEFMKMIHVAVDTNMPRYWWPEANCYKFGTKEGFRQMRIWDTNYAELRNMYFQRKNHRLKEEWIDTFCKWVESLPYAEEFIMYKGE